MAKGSRITRRAPLQHRTVPSRHEEHTERSKPRERELTGTLCRSGDDLPHLGHLGIKCYEEPDKHLKSIKSTDHSKCNFIFCSNGV